MNKSLATVSSAGVPKKKRFTTKVAAFIVALMMTLGLSALASPAFAAASICCSGSFTAAPGDPSTVTLTVTSYATEPVNVQVVITTPSSAGSSQLVDTVTTQPATDPTPDIPGDEVTPWTGSLGSFTVPAGATIQAMIGVTSIAAYTNPAVTPDPVLAVPPSAPTFVDKPGTVNDGVTLPSRECWVYAVNGTVYAAGTFVSITGPVTVTATLAQGCIVRPGTQPTYQWSETLSDDTPPPPADDKKQAVPPQAPDVKDEDGAANDTITVYGADGWSNPKLNGVSVVPGTYQVSPYVDGRGNLTVTYDLNTETHKMKDGSTSWSFGPFRFNDGTFVPPPHGEPNPVPDPAPAPAPAPNPTPAPLLNNGGTQQQTETEQELSTSGNRDYTVETAAAGQAPVQVVIGQSLIAIGMVALLMLLVAALWRRRDQRTAE